MQPNNTELLCVGDRVRRFQGGQNGTMCVNGTGVVLSVSGNNPYSKIKVQSDADNVIIEHDRMNLTKISSNNVKNMNTLTEKFALAFKKEPEKTFIKAGVMKADGTLTSEGNAIFIGYLLQKFGADFKKDVVDEIVKNDSENK